MKQLFYLSILTLYFVSCKNQDKKSLVAAAEVQIDEMPGECPFLTKDQEGNTVLSWVRLNNESTTSFCYAISEDGKTFSAPLVIPHTGNIQPHGENLPKILFKPSGEIIALWGTGNPHAKNKYAGLVYYTQSFDKGKTWNEPHALVNDTDGYDQRYYDVAILPNGEAGIIWLDNRKRTTKDGSALYFASTTNKNGFGDGQLISESCCQCCRTDLFVDSKGNIHALYRGILQDSIRDMIHIVSTDKGMTFSKPTKISDDNWVINGCPHTGPAMTENKAGLQFAWFTGGKNKGCYFASSVDNGQHYSPRSAISEMGSHPQLASMGEEEVMVAWDETIEKGNQFYKRIGIEKRNSNGQAGAKQFITPDTSVSAFPVIATVRPKEMLVAYTTKSAAKNYIRYQLIRAAD